MGLRRELQKSSRNPPVHHPLVTKEHTLLQDHLIFVNDEGAVSKEVTPETGVRRRRGVEAEVRKRLLPLAGLGHQTGRRLGEGKNWIDLLVTSPDLIKGKVTGFAGLRNPEGEKHGIATWTSSCTGLTPAVKSNGWLGIALNVVDEPEAGSCRSKGSYQTSSCGSCSEGSSRTTTERPSSSGGAIYE